MIQSLQTGCNAYNHETLLISNVILKAIEVGILVWLKLAITYFTYSSLVGCSILPRVRDRIQVQSDFVIAVAVENLLKGCVRYRRMGLEGTVQVRL